MTVSTWCCNFAPENNRYSIYSRMEDAPSHRSMVLLPSRCNYFSMLFDFAFIYMLPLSITINNFFFRIFGGKVLAVFMRFPNIFVYIFRESIIYLDRVAE